VYLLFSINGGAPKRRRGRDDLPLSPLPPPLDLTPRPPWRAWPIPLKTKLSMANSVRRHY